MRSGTPTRPGATWPAAFELNSSRSLRSRSISTKSRLIRPELQQLHEEGPFVDYIQAILAGRKLDLIVPVGAPAAFFVQRNRQRLPSATRMLIFGADHRRIPESSLTVDDATANHQNDMPAHLENILRVLPETKNVAVIVGSSPVERYWASELKRDFQPFADRLNITWFDELTLSEMLTRAATMPPNSAIFFLLLIEDAAGVPYTQNRALEKFREVANAPIFGLGDFELGRGVVGGPALQTQAIGERAAQVAIRVLAGEPPSRLRVAPLQYGAPSYDCERTAAVEYQRGSAAAGQHRSVSRADCLAAVSLADPRCNRHSAAPDRADRRFAA